MKTSYAQYSKLRDDAMTADPETWHCPNCGSTTGRPRSWDFGIDPDTGYHDAGEGCTECASERGE